MIGTISYNIQIQVLGKLDGVPSYYLVAIHVASKPVKMDAQCFGWFHYQFFLLYNDFLQINFICAQSSILLEFLKLFIKLLLIYVFSGIHFLVEFESFDKIWILVLRIVLLFGF